MGKTVQMNSAPVVSVPTTAGAKFEGAAGRCAHERLVGDRVHAGQPS
ncbi:hypothetical protein NDR87_03855 [Nocardia sp. CDC159]|nr:hypothetical protein [Nocardia sp. CDC159]